MPDVVEITVVGDEIEIRSADQGAVLIDVGGLYWDDSDERLLEACRLVLDNVQDFVAEITTDPWPGTSEMPEPVVHVTPTEIALSYETVLVLPSIPRAT